ncbi:MULTISPECIES: TetR/AcrR family transcriptional regulator [Streptomyces]|uniref:TetR family transcriptional regulator n=1 Tax=Streptomyces rutgersensis TaxID=53451 RepID=A0ABX6RMS3_9ACTN|nr:TetR family transcriptional regulator [Streptomyces rutgersensis]QNE81716.1 TetR family transcriptional regulator [Streptomyces rutgersensis]WSU37244.1 TetR family transcriptional regulator [Streptomyces gougerotii]
MTPDAPRRRGRPSRRTADGTPAARDRILAAAREEFSARGYDRTPIRRIAQAAGVDPALVHHYFGTKDEIFAAAVDLSLELPAKALPALLADGPDGVGERVARLFLGFWEDPATRGPVLAVVRSALTHEAARDIMRRFVLRNLLEHVAAQVPVPGPTLRAELAASQLIGVAMLRYVLELEPLASADVETVITTVAPTLQRYLTDPDAVPAAGA